MNKIFVLNITGLCHLHTHAAFQNRQDKIDTLMGYHFSFKIKSSHALGKIRIPILPFTQHQHKVPFILPILYTIMCSLHPFLRGTHIKVEDRNFKNWWLQPEKQPQLLTHTPLSKEKGEKI